MGPRRTTLGALSSVAIFLSVWAAGATDQIAELQARFDREPNAVHKAKLAEKLGDLQFEVTRRAGKDNDYKTVGLTLEKYRDNVRVAFDALKKQHPDAEKQSNGYRQLEIHVRKEIREVDEILLLAPEVYKPPMELVRQDLIAMDDEMLKMLFPRHPVKPPATASPTGQDP